MASAGSAGSPAMKMLSPQSVVIATAAVGLAGQEGRIMRHTVKYAVPYLILLGTVTWCAPLLLPQLVPS